MPSSGFLRHSTGFSLGHGLQKRNLTRSAHIPLRWTVGNTNTFRKFIHISTWNSRWPSLTQWKKLIKKQTETWISMKLVFSCYLPSTDCSSNVTFGVVTAIVINTFPLSSRTQKTKEMTAHLKVNSSSTMLFSLPQLRSGKVWITATIRTYNFFLGHLQLKLLFVLFSLSHNCVHLGNATTFLQATVKIGQQGHSKTSTCIKWWWGSLLTNFTRWLRTAVTPEH